MATRKEKLINSYQGLTGRRPAEAPTTTKEETKPAINAEELAETLNLDERLAAHLEAARYRKGGRPVGSKGRAKPADRATFIVPKEITRKLKYIALMENQLYKTIIADALTGYISKYEREKGTININD